MMMMMKEQHDVAEKRFLAHGYSELGLKQKIVAVIKLL